MKATVHRAKKAFFGKIIAKAEEKNCIWDLVHWAGPKADKGFSTLLKADGSPADHPDEIFDTFYQCLLS